MKIHPLDIRVYKPGHYCHYYFLHIWMFDYVLIVSSQMGMCILSVIGTDKNLFRSLLLYWNLWFHIDYCISQRCCYCGNWKQWLFFLHKEGFSWSIYWFLCIYYQLYFIGRIYKHTKSCSFSITKNWNNLGIKKTLRNISLVKNVLYTLGKQRIPWTDLTS